MGAIGVVVLLAVANVIYSRDQASLLCLIYISASWLFCALLSDLPETMLAPAGAPWLHVAQVLIGPLCAAMGAYGLNRWLSAARRDRLMDLCFRGAIAVCLAGALLCLFLPSALQLAVSAALTVGTLLLALWLVVRAARQGDRLAWGLVVGSVLTLPLQGGLYWLTWDITPLPTTLQAIVALSGLLSISLIAVTLWLRNHQDLQIRNPMRSRRDPVTQLDSSVLAVQKIVNAQRRLARTRRDGALMVVRLFEPEELLTQVGQYGLNEIYHQLARRMQSHIGLVNPAGRYYDRCFVALIETLHSPRWIRTLGLRVAYSLRQPLEVTALNGERIQLKACIGVGMVHLSGAKKDVTQLLHEAQEMATAARSMRLRAAFLDELSHRAVPLERAELGASWHAMRSDAPRRAQAPRPARPGSRSPAHAL